MGVLWACSPLLMVGAYFWSLTWVFSMRMGDRPRALAPGGGARCLAGLLRVDYRADQQFGQPVAYRKKNALPPVLFVARGVLGGLGGIVPLMAPRGLPLSDLRWKPCWPSNALASAGRC
jgi:hypothetical protein